MFRPVAPEELIDLWPQVSPGLSQIKRRCNASWTVEQIRAHLLQGRASLYLSDVGFVILEKCSEPMTFEPYLNVWLMFFKPKEGMKRRDEIVKWLDGAQRYARCAWWQFGSPRDEWASTIAPYCEKVMTIWRRR